MIRIFSIGLALCWLAGGMGASVRASDLPSLRISDVQYQSGQGVVLQLSYPDALAGTEWTIYSCDVRTGDPSADESLTWTLADASLVLGPSGVVHWTDAGQSGRVPIEDCPVRLYLVRQVSSTGDDGDPDTLVLRATLTEGGESDADALSIEMLDPAQLRDMMRVGFDSIEGFSAGKLHAQAGWIAVGEVVVQRDLIQAGDQAVVLRGTESRMTRKVESDGGHRATIEMSVYVSSESGIQAAHPQLPPRTSSSIAFHRNRGFFAFDGDGQGGGRWVLVPDSLYLDQWVDLVIQNDYQTKEWSIVVQGEASMDGLGFRNDELEHIEEINLYAGNNREMLVDSIAVTEQAAEKNEGYRREASRP